MCYFFEKCRQPMARRFSEAVGHEICVFEQFFWAVMKFQYAVNTHYFQFCSP